jgi:hypothetical protein
MFNLSFAVPFDKNTHHIALYDMHHLICSPHFQEKLRLAAFQAQI